jgi:hypothetical protein
MFCRQCGREALDSQAFCRFCGTGLAKPNAATSAPSSLERSPHVPNKTQERAVGIRGLWSTWNRLPRVARWIIGISIIILILTLLRPSSPAPEHDSQQNFSSPAKVQQPPGPTRANTQENAPSPPAASAQQEPSEPININATDLLAAYEADEKSASAHYEKKKVAMTGTLTGVFVPPPAVLQRMAEQGRSATAFVTMASPPLSSPSEAFLSAGIKAYLKNSSLFGESEALNLTVGESVTLVCTVTNGRESLSGKSGYSLMLEDCQIPTRPESNANAPAQSPEGPSAGAAQHSTNADIAQQIKTQMQQARFGNVKIAATGDGEVTISGIVTDTMDRGKAYTIASQTQGVTFVNNNALAIEGGEPPYPPVTVFSPALKECLESKIRTETSLAALAKGCPNEFGEYIDSCLSYGRTNRQCYQLFAATVSLTIRRERR